VISSSNDLHLLLAECLGQRTAHTRVLAGVVLATFWPKPSCDTRQPADAESLDADLVQLLQDPLNRALATVNVGPYLAETVHRANKCSQTSLKSRFDPELQLIIQLTLYKLSVWNIGATYGAKLQDLRYRVPVTSGQPSTRACVSESFPGGQV